MLSVHVSAQTSLLDILKGKQKAINVSSQNIINNALMDNLFIVRQQYRLVRDGDFYGKNGKTYYGEAYSLGVKVGGGLYFRSNILKPWQGDADYERVNASNNYTTEMFYCYQRNLRDSIYQVVDLELGSQYTNAQNADSTLYKHTEAVSDFGLVEEHATGQKEGFMIWAYADTDVQDSAMHVTLRQNVFNVDADADSTLLMMSPDEGEKIIGGLYVVPKYERAGRIQLLLAGVAVKNLSNSWALQLLTDRTTSAPADESAPTPSSKGKRKKKGGSEPAQIK